MMTRGALFRVCGAPELHERLLRSDPDYAGRRQEIERIARDFERAGLGQLRKEPTEIPVVVHVVHHPDFPETNVPDDQIRAQIEALNRDFRRQNTAEIAAIPSSAFSSLASDTNIQFKLATVDPYDRKTTGITRTESRKPYFTTVLRDVMSAATDGADPWDRDRYLNIWVCGRLVGEDGLTRLGYGTYPGVSDGRDGVVVTHWAFGSGGSAEPPFDLGRTAVHEVGHWLNLLHLWGDAEAGGPGDDFVSDTPPQNGPNFEHPEFPHRGSASRPDGDMFMNYMDYTDDACTCMFTAGQVLRMHAALESVRQGFPTLASP